MVYWLGKPAVINDNDIKTVKLFLEEFSDVKIEKSEVHVNDTVVITEGPLVSQEGSTWFFNRQDSKTNNTTVA